MDYDAQGGDEDDKEAQSVDDPSEQNVHPQLPKRRDAVHVKASEIHFVIDLRSHRKHHTAGKEFPRSS